MSLTITLCSSIKTCDKTEYKQKHLLLKPVTKNYFSQVMILSQLLLLFLTKHALDLKFFLL